MALAVGALLVFLALPQRAFHGFDTDWYAALLQEGELATARTHVAYLPLCQLVLGVVRWWGGGAVQAMLVASALGSAVGVFCLHRAALRLVDAPGAGPVTIAVALTPACFYYATAAEVHGVFAAGSGAWWWMFARWRDDPRLPRALVVGAVGGLAATLHAFGHVLPVLFVVAMACVQRVPRRVFVLAVAANFVMHGLVAAAATAWLGHGAVGQGDAATAMLASWWRTMDLRDVPGVLWREVVVAFLPWSLLAGPGLFVARARPWAMLYGWAVLLHAPVVCLFLARPGENFHERGGYLLPTALPAVLAAAAWLSKAWWQGALLVAAVVTAVVVAPRWPARWRPEFVAGVVAMQRVEDRAWLVGPTEIEGLRSRCEGVVAAEIVRSLESFYGVMEGASPQQVVDWLEITMRILGGGRTWVVTQEARDSLQRVLSSAALATWDRHVAATYAVAPLQQPGLAGVCLVRRP